MATMMSARFPLAHLVMMVCAVIPVAASASDSLPGVTADFLEFNCLDCHEGSSAEAGLDLTTLEADLSDGATRHRWVRVIDRVKSGEMPPEDYGELDPEEQKSFLSTTSDWVRREQLAEYERLGRVRGRRLTNLQLENTLHDLLSVDVPLASLMPEEPRSEGFTGVAEAQSMSHFHLETHLRIVDAALDAAFDRAADDKESWQKHYTAEELARANPKRRCRDPEMREGLAVVWSSGLAFYGRISSTRVKEGGWYRIRFKASAVKKPEDHGVWCTVRSGACRSSDPVLDWIGSFEAENDPKELEYEAWISAGDLIEIRPGDRTLKRGRFKGGQVGVGEGEPQDLPGVALHEMTLERIYPGGSLEDVRQSLFGDLQVKVDDEDTLQFSNDVTKEELAAQVKGFARRAFRRPVEDSHVAPYIEMMRQSLDANQGAMHGLRSAYRAILCSPRFLYFNERPGELDEFAVANRLSYMFWNSMPDEELLQLAKSGELSQQEVLHEQVERMLSDERGRNFVRDFTAEWLDLSEINATQPDRRMFRDYDPVVQNAMLAETWTFVHDLLKNNRSITQLIDSDFTFLNSRLARYYGVDHDGSDELRRVSLDDESRRGGLLAQGAILKVTANGTNTSPVLRGVWVSERLLGKTIPPPPANVPAIEPDTRGATTIREMLAKHKSDPGCASCHRNIDPPGFALENFDAAGRWRDNYRSGKGGKKSKAAAIDASYELPDGRKFGGFDEFCALVTSDPEPLARNVAEKLIVYGTGAPVEFAEREMVQQIVERAAEDNYGLRSIVHEVVASPIFLSK